MSQSTIVVIIAIVAVVLLLLFLLLRGRKQHVSFDALAEPAARGAPSTPPPAAPRVATIEEGHGVGSEVSAAIEDVVDQFVGLDAHPSGQPKHPIHGDPLTTLKGLGPKAEIKLHELGVTTFAQIAAWDAGDVAAIDAQMGAFKGRITRDRWVDQAKLLAGGETAAFEAEFGKLGG